MAPKLPLSISHSCTPALYHALMTAASPSSRPPLRSIANVRRLHDITAKKNSSAAMGRSGYDTTNMKTAARPRPASKGSGPGQGDGKTTKAKQTAPASQQQQQQQKQGQQGRDGSQSTGTTVSGQGSEKRFDPTPAKIPTGREVEGEPLDDLPLPSLVGRGWTFWL